MTDPDRLFGDYFRRQVPDPFPPPPGVGARGQGRGARARLLAAAAVLLALGLALSGGRGADRREPPAGGDLMKGATADGSKAGRR